MDQDATWYGGRPRTGHIVSDGDPPLHSERGTAAPTSRPCLLWPNGRPSQLLLSSFNSRIPGEPRLACFVCCIRSETKPVVQPFYSAPQCSHCKRCTSYGNSVRPSVTRRYCVKTTACSTVQFALSDSKMCLVLSKPKIFPRDDPFPMKFCLKLTYPS